MIFSRFSLYQTKVTFDQTSRSTSNGTRSPELESGVHQADELSVDLEDHLDDEMRSTQVIGRPSTLPSDLKPSKAFPTRPQTPSPTTYVKRNKWCNWDICTFILIASLIITSSLLIALFVYTHPFWGHLPLNNMVDVLFQGKWLKCNVIDAPTSHTIYQKYDVKVINGVFINCSRSAIGPVQPTNLPVGVE